MILNTLQASNHSLVGKATPNHHYLLINSMIGIILSCVRLCEQFVSGTWCDIFIKQRLMKAAKSEGGLNRGRMRNSDSDHKCWMQTLNHFTDVNQRMEEGVKKHGPLHKDLAKTRMKRDAEVALKWFEENNPFDHNRDRQLLVSFSTGFTGTANIAVNAERAPEVGREMQKRLDRQSVTSTMEIKC